MKKTVVKYLVRKGSYENGNELFSCFSRTEIKGLVPPKK